MAQNKHQTEIKNTPRRYPCKYCEKTLSTQASRDLHHRIHLGDKRHKCTYCQKGFVDPSALKCHERIHMEIKPFVCMFCEKGFAVSSGLNTHLKTHIGEKPNECKICGRGFADTSALKRHVQSHTGTFPERYTCDYCNKKFHHKGHYQTHLRVHTKEKPSKCEISPVKVYMQKSHVSNHMHSFLMSKEPLECTFCQQRFATPFQLNNHTNSIHTHANEKNFKCEVCMKAFKYVETLECHKLKIHEKSAKFYECPDCKTKFSEKSSVNKHIKAVHLQLKEHVCKICRKAYTSKGSLDSHIRRHLGELYWKCEVCGKGFTCKPDMERHTLRHKNIKQYECLICGGMWKHKLSHDMHLRRHLGEKTMFCYTCGHESLRRQNLDRHMINEHGEEMKHACPLCDKRFYLFSNVQQHLKRVHYNPNRKINLHAALQVKLNRAAHGCIFCGERYANLNYFHNHIRKHLYEKVVFCKQCGLETYTKVKREWHLVNEHGKEKQHSCPLCDKRFINGRAVRLHLNEVHLKIKE